MLPQTTFYNFGLLESFLPYHAHTKKHSSHLKTTHNLITKSPHHKL